MPILLNLPTVSGGQSLSSASDLSGNQTQVVQLATGATPAPITPTNPIPVSMGLTISGGASYESALAPATPVLGMIKSSAGNLYGVIAFNILSTPLYLKFFDNSAVTLGSTNANWQFAIPANTGAGGFAILLPVPRSFAHSLQWAVTNQIAYNDASAITANSCIVDFSYN